MVKIKDITSYLESIAPRSLQESYDNAGLITGSGNDEVKGILCTLDCIEAIVDEAIQRDCNLIVAHHPIVFSGLKQLNGKNYVERTIIKAIKNDIAIYAIHTNLDNVSNGVNEKFAELLSLQNTRILAPKSETLLKLETYIPTENTDSVLEAIHAAGGGSIGNYTECSFRILGTGTFTPNKQANPTIGEKGSKEFVEENKVEIIFPSFNKGAVIAALKKAHPYEEVGYYIVKTENQNQEIGSGMIGELKQPLSPDNFLKYIKDKLSLGMIKYTSVSKQISKVALCGGSGSFLLKSAMAQGADAYVSADFKYHEYFDSEEKIMITDIGHYESEIATKELLNGFISEKFPNIASYLSEVDTNPVQYF